MGLISELGIAAGFLSNKNWTLQSLDVKDNKFVGQFIPESYTENAGAELDESKTLGTQNPGIQWLNAETETITFRGRIFKTSPVQSVAFEAIQNPLSTAFSIASGQSGPLIGTGKVRDQIEKLKTLSKKNEDLKRPERFLFTYGSEIALEVLVQRVSNIVYDEIRSDGTIRGASFDVSLLKLKVVEEKITSGLSLASAIKTTAGIVSTVSRGKINTTLVGRRNLINIRGGSLHTVSKVVTAKQGDTYEKIALAEYGNPNLGDILRRAHPDNPETTAGQQVAIVKREEVVQISQTPQSIALRDTPENKFVIDYHLALRGKSATLRV